MAPSPNEPAKRAGDAARREASSLMDEAQADLAEGRFEAAADAAERAVAMKVDPARALPLLARAREARGDLSGAFDAYAQAMDAAPKDPQISGETGRLALRLGKYALAEQVLSTHVRQAPPSAEAIAGLAWAQTGLKAYDRAQATLQAGLEADPAQPKLWLALAKLLCVQGRHAQAIVFFEESLRLDMTSPQALDGIADALLLGAGDVDRAISAGEAALEAAQPAEIPALTAAQARRLLAAGRLEAGWTAYAARFGPGPAAALDVRMAAQRWAPGIGFAGRLLLIGGDSLVDELLLSSIVPSLAGQPLILAVDDRLQALVERSFPEAMVVRRLQRRQDDRLQLTAVLDSPHVHGGELVGAWAPLRAMAHALRSEPTDFAGASPWFQPDEHRIAHWRAWLEELGPGPKIGVTWRPSSPGIDAAWEAPPLPQLIAALTVPGVQLVAAQAEEIQGEVIWIRETFGLEIHDPPMPVKQGDLDEQAAFACALDLVVGPPDVATYLAAASGASTWFLSPPSHWARLGAETYPWFPDARVIAAAAPDDWGQAMADLGLGLAALAMRS